jgi:hypothetical protein
VHCTLWCLNIAVRCLGFTVRCLGCSFRAAGSSGSTVFGLGDLCRVMSGEFCARNRLV